MKRREFIFFTIALPLVSCKSIYNPLGIRGDVVIVEGHKKLTSNQYGKTFIIEADSTLDLSGFTLFGKKKKSSDIVRLAVTIKNRAKIINGSIDGYINAISVISNLKPPHLDELISVSKSTARIIGDRKRITTNRNQEIINIKFKKTIRIALYLQSFTVGAKIQGCEFNNTGLMHIYVDHGAADHIIKNNTFAACGYNHTSGREAIALDACINISINNNTFTPKHELRSISAYTNWGENGITREVSRGHNIRENKFTGVKKGISLASRHLRRVAGKKTVDYCMNCIIEKNTFINVELAIEDFGTLNYIQENKLIKT